VYLNVDGHRVYAYTANRGLDAARPTVIFVHGAANDHGVWALQSRYFAYHGWNALALDLPGHGRSGGAARSSVRELADWLARVMDASSTARAALVGHSMGSLIVLETAAAHADRVSKIALIGIAVPMPVSEPLLDASRANDHLAYEMINVFAHGNAAQIGGNRVPGMWMLGNNMRLMERAAPGALYADFSACNGYASGLEAAGKVQCPALLVLGQRDLMTPARAARDVAAKLRDAKTITLPGAGHSLMAERPDEVLDALMEFLT